MNKYLLPAVLVVVVAVGGFFLLQNRSQTTQGNTTPSPTKTAQPTMEPNPTATTSAVKEITVQNKGFTFDPSEIRVKKGDMIKLTFKNTGGSHDFMIEELNVATKQLQKDEQDSVEFTAEKTGSFEYYCSVGNHRAMGMKGMLIVE